MYVKRIIIKGYTTVIKNYIFDFGNVLGEFSPEKLTAPYVSDNETKKYLSDVVFDRVYWDKLDDGTISDDEVKQKLRERVPPDMADLACLVYDNWVRTMTPIKDMQQLILDICKTDKKLYLLSNISIGFANTYKDVEWIKQLFDRFDGLVFSGTIGMVKPDREIFEYLLNKYELEAEECLFVDDSTKNIDGAKAVGINTYLFDGDVDKLRAYLHI